MQKIFFIIIILVFLLFITLSVVLLNPGLHKNINIADKLDNTVTTHNNIQNKNIVLDNKQTISQKDITPTNFNTVKNIKADLNSVDTLKNVAVSFDNTSAKTDYRQDEKEGVEPEYPQFSENKAQQEQNKAEQPHLSDRQLLPPVSVPAQQTDTLKENSLVQLFASSKTPVNKSKPVKQINCPDENILWSKWLQQVTRKISLSVLSKAKDFVQTNTTYIYSFDVDKNGIISNVSVKLTKGTLDRKNQTMIYWIENEIKALSGSSILKFPECSQMTKVRVTDKIIIVPPPKIRLLPCPCNP